MNNTCSSTWAKAVVRLEKPALPPQDAAAGQMLVVAAAVGVSSCFGAPVSGERCVFSFPLWFGLSCSSVVSRVFTFAFLPTHLMYLAILGSALQASLTVNLFLSPPFFPVNTSQTNIFHPLTTWSLFTVPKLLRVQHHGMKFHTRKS